MTITLEKDIDDVRSVQIGQTPVTITLENDVDDVRSVQIGQTPLTMNDRKRKRDDHGKDETPVDARKKLR